MVFHHNTRKSEIYSGASLAREAQPRRKLADYDSRVPSVTTQYGLPHYAYMARWTCSFSFYLPCSSLTLCSIHMDNLIPLNDTTPLPLCPGPCSTYDAVLIPSITTSLFINTYVSLYIQVYIPCTLLSL